MGEVGASSGYFAWCFSATGAVATHILLLFSLGSEPRAEETSASTAITWEAVASNSEAPAVDSTALPPPAATRPSTSRTSVTRARKPAALQPSAALIAADANPASVAAPNTEPMRGVAAPSSTSSGSVGEPGAHPPSNAAAAAPAVTMSTALRRAPRLLPAHDLCAGYFPGTAAANRGQVQLSIDVDAAGHPHPSQTLSAFPRGQGFENAARACAQHLKFAPALDAHGQPVAAQARIALSFDRS